MRLIYLFIAICGLLLTACDNTGPSSPDFLITSVEFTGDSTGNEPLLRGAQTVPYCEFTIEWDAPAPDARFEFQVYRSQNSDIESNPESAEVLATLLDRQWIDSEELEWESEYYYAVRATPTAQGSEKWSNEVHVLTPVSPFPTPGELSYEKHLFYTCSLSWEACQDSRFQSAYLLRSLRADIEHTAYPRDTLLIITEDGPGQFTDSTITDRDSRYYVLEVRVGDEIVAYSNEVCFTPGADFPWIIGDCFDMGGSLFDVKPFGFMSQDSRSVYCHFFTPNKGDEVVLGINTKNSRVFGFIYYPTVYDLAERPDGSILMTYRDDDDNFHMSSLSPDLDTVLQTADFNRRVGSVTEIPLGILCSTVNKVLLLDPISFEVVDSTLNPFISAVSFDELNRSFLMNNTSVKVIRNTDLGYLGRIEGSYQSIQAGLDGNLYCFSETGAEWYCAENLTLEGSFDFPSNTLVAAVLPGREYLIYVVHRADTREENMLDIYDTRNGEHIGSIGGVPDSSDWASFLLPSWNGDFLWGFLDDFGSEQIQCFNITL